MKTMTKKPKKHKPFTRKDIGKTFSFCREPIFGELPPIETTIAITCSGVAPYTSLVKTRGKLINIEKTTYYSKGEKPTHDYQYKFIEIVNGVKWVRYSCNYYMDRMINKSYEKKIK